MSFAEKIANYLAAASVDDIEVYTESCPAVKNITPSIVCVVPAGYTEDVTTSDRETFNLRFIVSGSAVSCLSKAEEIYNYFVKKDEVKPRWANETSFLYDGIYIMKIFPESYPAISRNRGNIFFATFVLRFLTAS